MCFPATVMYMANSMLLWRTLDSVLLPIVIKPKVVTEVQQYSGFNFSHYDLPFPTRCCIPFVRSGLYQLVMSVKGFRVSAHYLDSHSVLSIGVDTTFLVSRVVYR